MEERNMIEAWKAILKSTGETVTILDHDPQAQGARNDGRYLCVLPPQSPGHEKRKEWIGADKLKFTTDK